MLNILAQTTTYSSDSGIGAAVAWFYLIIVLAAVVVAIIGLWKMFQKAGRPGWASIIPIYNSYILIKIAGRPGWWLFLYLIPLVNIVVSIILALDIAKRFRQSEVFGIVLLWIFSAVGYTILGFGEAEYISAKES